MQNGNRYNQNNVNIKQSGSTKTTNTFGQNMQPCEFKHKENICNRNNVNKENICNQNNVNIMKTGVTVTI